LTASNDPGRYEKGETESLFGRVPRFDNTAEFSADVLTGQFDFGKQEGFDLGAHEEPLYTKK